MSEQVKENEMQTPEVQEAQIAESDASTDASAITKKPKFTKKKIAIIVAGVVVIAAIALVFLLPSKFERVKMECVSIVGIISGGEGYFNVDTYPIEDYAGMDPLVQAVMMEGAQEKALEAIRYANKELGFNGAVYSKMLQTTAMMGRQSEENDKYRVSWTYHPDEGLEVTYEEK